MKKIIILILLLLSSRSAFAETYAVEDKDGKLIIINYFENSKDTLEDVLKSMDLQGLPCSVIDPSSLPSREDRKYWKKSGGNIVVDSVKKQKDVNAKLDRDEKKDQILNKLNITKEEFKDLSSVE